MVFGWYFGAQVDSDYMELLTFMSDHNMNFLIDFRKMKTLIWLLLDHLVDPTKQNHLSFKKK